MKNIMKYSNYSLKYYIDKEEVIKRFDRISNLDKDQIIDIINHIPVYPIYVRDYETVKENNDDK